MFQGASFVKRDIIRFYYPVWNFSVEMMKQGVLPLWNPYNSYGTPFFADIQTCVLYPLTLLLYLPNYCWAFNFYILLHLALAGFFTAVWMRDCRASREGSFLSGLAFALGGYVMSVISLTISLATLVYFPLVLLALRRSLHTRDFFWKAVTALILLVQYLAGDPAIFFATLIVLTLFVIYKTLVESFARKKPYLKFTIDATKIVATFLGLSLFQTLLFFEFLMHSNRAQQAYDQLTMWSVQYNDLVSIFFPYFSDLSIVFMDYWVRQSWIENIYAGVTVLLLACAAFKGVRKNNLIGYHVLLALFGIALALGRFCSVYDVLYHGFPFFKFIRYPVRFLFLFNFALACLAGFGLDEVLSYLRRKNVSYLSNFQARVAAFFIVFLAALVILSMVYSIEIESKIFANVRQSLLNWTHQDIDMETLKDLILPVLFNLKRTLIFVSLFFVGILAAWHFKPRKTLLAIFFTLIVFSDLVEVNVIEIQLDREEFRKPSKNLSCLLRDTGLFRVLASPQAVTLQYEPPGSSTFGLTLRALRETLTPNLLLPHRISDVSGYDSIFLQEAIGINSERRNIKDPAQRRFYDMLNIKYMVSPKENIGKGYRLVQREQPVNLFLNERALPRAFLVAKAEIIKDRKEILTKLISKEYNPEAVLYLEERPEAENPGKSARQIPDKNQVTLTSYSLNDVHMTINSTASQWLFFSDMYYPGWKATIDGKSVKIHRANYAFRAIEVMAGSYDVEWKYDPILFRIGVIISSLTGLALALYGIRRILSKSS